MKTIMPNNYVTKDLFVTEINRLDGKIDKVALSLLKTQADVETIKRTMSTKDDINLILNRIDHLTHKVDVFEKKVIVHDYRLNELEEKCQFK